MNSKTLQTKKGTSKDMFDRIKGKTCFSMLRVKNEF